ncbi:MAG: hypothetical protein M0P72_03925 [Metallibacterium scheffleri]|uniref:hypothetical protein n=1 Tax=Metallibacterium scheffleri TaxID=993689 RepID=UPI0026F1A54A|nr:hypothetical protein [Metallibacterium scheffleri]MCK9366284.1 hypothetical protein [Metallibacterium scheffleri]
MPNNLHVTLDKSTTPWCVDIDQSGNANHVSQSPDVQTITWQLTGNAASGSFVALTDPDPGFAWVGTAPPSGVFSNLTLSANGNQLTISDLNNSTSTQGTWTYILRINVDGVVYQSKTTSLTATTTNPMIKNQ